jgi:hypothetical protein
MGWSGFDSFGITEYLMVGYCEHGTGNYVPQKSVVMWSV